MTYWVRYLDPEPTALAQMLGGIIEANLTKRPELSVLLKTPATYAISVVDIGVDVSIRVTPGQVRIRDGVVGRPDLVIQGDSQTLAGMSSVPLRFGLPDPRTAAGREVLAKLRRRELRVRGMLSHPLKLARLNKLLSVG